MTNKYFYILIFLLISNSSFSQNKKNKTRSPFWKKVHFGGGIQAGFSTEQTTLGISPSAIYSFSDKFAMGIGSSYLFSSFKYSDVKYHVFGMSALALYNPHKYVQISSEFEELNVNVKTNDYTDSYWQPALYLGLGYRVGKHSSIGFRYDFLFEENKSIYDSAFTPFFRIYF